MGKSDTKDLLKFLKPFDPDKIEIVLWLRDFAWTLLPKTNEIIYDNYNAVAIGWSPTDKISDLTCTIALGRSSKNIHFGFYYGNKLDDPDKILLGKGNQYRYVLVTDKQSFPKAYIKKLVQQAHINSLVQLKPMKENIQGQTIVKSISAKKRPDKKSKVLSKSKK